MTHGGRGPWLWSRPRFLGWDAKQKQTQTPQITMELAIEEQDYDQLKSFFTTREAVIRIRGPHKEWGKKCICKSYVSDKVFIFKIQKGFIHLDSKNLLQVSKKIKQTFLQRDKQMDQRYRKWWTSLIIGEMHIETKPDREEIIQINKQPPKTAGVVKNVGELELCRLLKKTKMLQKLDNSVAFTKRIRQMSQSCHFLRYIFIKLLLLYLFSS